jgi:hypothetical protein
MVYFFAVYGSMPEKNGGKAYHKKRIARYKQSFFVGSTGEMSNQIFEDLTEIYRVAAKLKL